jgi:hypothetical protein
VAQAAFAPAFQALHFSWAGWALALAVVASVFVFCFLFLIQAPACQALSMVQPLQRSAVQAKQVRMLWHKS